MKPKLSRDIALSARKRLASVQRRAAKRGPVSLRCPRCFHFLTGIISESGDFAFQTGERSNLYCTWPECPRYGDRVRVTKAVKTGAPKDGTSCCAASPGSRKRAVTREKRKSRRTSTG